MVRMADSKSDKRIDAITVFWTKQVERHIRQLIHKDKLSNPEGVAVLVSLSGSLFAMAQVIGPKLLKKGMDVDQWQEDLRVMWEGERSTYRKTAEVYFYGMGEGDDPQTKESQ